MSDRLASHRFAELVDQLIFMLAAARRCRLGECIGYLEARTEYSASAVYRWRQGRLCPPPDTVELLARMGKEEARLDRGWGEGLLKAGRHPGAGRLVQELWGPRELRAVSCNLPARTHTAFVDRRRELRKVLDLLSPENAAHLVTVGGIGGVGKTTLALEAANRCLRASQGGDSSADAPTFEAIIFTSAKQEVLSPHGILATLETQRTLRDIFREIASTLDRPEVARAAPHEQPKLVREMLARQRTLLIVDNLETVRDRDGVLAFLYEHLPLGVKVIITTRESLLFTPVRLEALSREDGLQLIDHEAQAKGVTLTDEEALSLYGATGGLPAAIVYTVGRLAAHYSIGTVIHELKQATGDVVRFCFRQTLDVMRDQHAHHLLMALAMFPAGARREAMVAVAGQQIDSLEADRGFAQLLQHSLIRASAGRYSMLSLTREYALAELVTHTAFADEARRRWVDWYLQFVREHGGHDWQEWHIDYDRLEEEWTNILHLFAWCEGRDDGYGTVKLFWQGLELRSFTEIYGHSDDFLTWAEWLVTVGERRADWPVVVQAISGELWALATRGGDAHLKEADLLQARAWDLAESITGTVSPIVLHQLAVDTAWLRIRQRRWHEAHGFLDLGWERLITAGLSNVDRSRHQTNTLYFRGVAHFGSGELTRATAVFEQMLKNSATMGWQRATIYAQNWLADIAMARGELEEADALLRIGFPVAERNKDYRRSALLRRSLAVLRRLERKGEESERWAQEALEGFARLGMQPECDEMRALLGLGDSAPEEVLEAQTRAPVSSTCQRPLA